MYVDLCSISSDNSKSVPVVLTALAISNNDFVCFTLPFPTKKKEKQKWKKENLKKKEKALICFQQFLFKRKRKKKMYLCLGE